MSDLFVQIAIDGESATGKSTLANCLAEKFSQIGSDIRIVDTGQAYRLLTWVAVNKHLINNGELPDQSARELIDLAGSGRISFLATTPGKNCPIALDKIDYSSQLQSAHIQIDEHVSLVAKCGVRPNLITLFQLTAADLGSVIMVGRDIGDRVLPTAIKFFLVADRSVRAVRRAGQLSSSHQQTQASLTNRDHIDTQHKSLVKPADAIVINTQFNDIPAMTRIAWEEIARKISINSGTD